jgi:hypothetical protein
MIRIIPAIKLWLDNSNLLSAKSHFLPVHRLTRFFRWRFYLGNHVNLTPISEADSSSLKVQHTADYLPTQDIELLPMTQLPMDHIFDHKPFQNNP